MGPRGSYNTAYILPPQGLLLDSNGTLFPDYWKSIFLLLQKPYHLPHVSPRTLMPSASLQFLFIWASLIHTWHKVRSSRAEVLSILFHMSLKHLEQCPPCSRYPVIGPGGSCGKRGHPQRKMKACLLESAGLPGAYCFCLERGQAQQPIVLTPSWRKGTERENRWTLEKARGTDRVWI